MFGLPNQILKVVKVAFRKPYHAGEACRRWAIILALVTSCRDELGIF